MHGCKAPWALPLYEKLFTPHLCSCLLQVCLSGARLKGPLGPTHVSKIALPDLGIYDNEYIER